MTVIYELTRQHETQGQTSTIVVGRGTRHDYTVGRVTEVNYSPRPGRGAKAIDVICGRLGLPRYFGRSHYRAAVQALPSDTSGWIFLHNNPAALASLQRRARHARVALYLHNFVFRTYSRRETRKVIDAADAVVCVSHYLADAIANHAGFHSKKLLVVNNGIDTDRFSPSPSRGSTDEVVVLFLGRVIPEKGADLLLRAVQRLGPSLAHPFKLRIVGSSGFSATDALSTYELSLRRLAMPVESVVEFSPFVDRGAIMDEYAKASVFCVPSNWSDPCPLTLLEGLACGLPSVVARRGGIPEVAGDAALYFDPPDCDALAARLALLIDDAGARTQWGEAARQRAKSFSWHGQYGRLIRSLDSAKEL